MQRACLRVRRARTPPSSPSRTPRAACAPTCTLLLPPASAAVSRPTLSLSLSVCLHSSVSLLIADIGRAPLRSASERICDRSFSAAGCRAKNALPSYVRHDKNYSTFKKSLKGRYVYNNNNNNNKRICIAPQCRNFRDYNRSWRTVTN